MAHFNLRGSDGTLRPFHHRGTTADVGVLNQIFKNRDYALEKLLRGKELRELGGATQRPLIIDAGANIGASVCWFAMVFPTAHIVAFEPDAANFELLQRNTEGLNVDLHHAGIASHDGHAQLLDVLNGEWGYRTMPDESGTVPLVSMDRIVMEKRAAGYTPFIAKIDIEGGEEELFSSSTDWFDRFPLAIVELHDYMIPCAALCRNFLKTIAGLDRDFVQIGENTFSIRNTPVSA